jgi:histidine triad (HIT) family protein
MNCIFCAIAKGEIPATIVGRNDQALAFDDINPQAPTHVLVIPTSHFDNVGELALADPSSLKAIFELADEIAANRQLAGYRTVFNTGAEAGQTVFHAHLHLLGGRALQWPPG